MYRVGHRFQRRFSRLWLLPRSNPPLVTFSRVIVRKVRGSPPSRPNFALSTPGGRLTRMRLVSPRNKVYSRIISCALNIIIAAPSYVDHGAE